MKDEDLSRLVNTTWNEWDKHGFVNWDTICDEDKEVYAVIGRALYDAGFQAGADSVRNPGG